MKHIILIIADSLRADYCGFLNKRVHFTSFLDKIAREGLMFKNAYANAPYTPMAVCSIFSGTLPIFKGSPLLSKNRLTITEVLRNLGFSTIGFIAFNAFAKVFSGNGRGCEHLLEVPESYSFVDNVSKLHLSFRSSKLKEQIKEILYFLDTSMCVFLFSKFSRFSHMTIFPYLYSQIMWKLFHHLPRNVRDVMLGVDGKHLIETSTNLLKSLIREKTMKKPLFLWYHFMDTHYPYNSESEDPEDFIYRQVLIERLNSTQESKSEAEIQKVRNYYQEGVKVFDRNLKFLFEELEELGILSDSYVIITSDHGEELFEELVYGHWGWLSERTLHIPMILWGAAEKGIIDKPISQTDIFPLILDLLLYYCDKSNNLTNREIKFITTFKKIVGAPNPILEEKDVDLTSKIIISESLTRSAGSEQKGIFPWKYFNAILSNPAKSPIFNREDLILRILGTYISEKKNYASCEIRYSLGNKKLIDIKWSKGGTDEEKKIIAAKVLGRLKEILSQKKDLELEIKFALLRRYLTKSDKSR